MALDEIVVSSQTKKKGAIVYLKSESLGGKPITPQELIDVLGDYLICLDPREDSEYREGH